MTEAVRLDVRSRVAAAAGVSTGNISKVKRLIGAAHPSVIQAVRNGDVSIHRGWLWCKRPHTEQVQLLARHQSDKGAKAIIRTLVARQRSKKTAIIPIELQDVLQRLLERNNSAEEPVHLTVVKTRGKTLFITEELVRALEFQAELPHK